MTTDLGRVPAEPGSKALPDAPADHRPSGYDPSRWLEVRPDHKGKFDEIVARFADGMVHVEMMSNKSVYIGFYCDDGRAQQLWISSDKKLHCHSEDASDAPPRFTAWGVDRRDSDGSGEAGETGTGSTEGDSAGLQGIAQDMSHD